jgi:hypothetical protein
MMPKWWLFCVNVVLSGHWQRCCVEAWREPCAGLVVATARAHDGPGLPCRGLSVSDHAECAEHIPQVFETQELHTHGNHVLLLIRGAATCMFLIEWWRLLERVPSWRRRPISRNGDAAGLTHWIGLPRGRLRCSIAGRSRRLCVPQVAMLEATIEVVLLVGLWPKLPRLLRSGA